MSVTRISNRNLDPICQWLVKNKFPLTLRNYLQIAYWRDLKLSELDAESIAEIPDFLLPKGYCWDNEPHKRRKIAPSESRDKR